MRKKRVFYIFGLKKIGTNTSSEQLQTLMQPGGISGSLSFDGLMTKEYVQMSRSALSTFKAKEEKIEKKKLELNFPLIAEEIHKLGRQDEFPELIEDDGCDDDGEKWRRRELCHRLKLKLRYHYIIVIQQMELSEWTDIVKTATFKELAPYDPDWGILRPAVSLKNINIMNDIKSRKEDEADKKGCCFAMAI
ncbi:hypothetical protein L2E82_45272 [Cichorium intybus]|uniref:Uncharacterized protein n=1 Tax=Cichorium intybus TaxID=13427 RepID=A0ACB8ZT29_CICIN|nr:hypothetical protein L2E82_45272 [Cichorium intybus]